MTENKRRGATSQRRRHSTGTGDHGWSSWSLEKKLTVAIIPIGVPIVAALIGLGPALMSDEPDGSNSLPDGPPPSEKQAVPRFDGVVGNFELSRSFISFLEDNDGNPVQLEQVGFNEATAEDFITEVVEDGGKSVLQVSYVQVWTECDPQLPEETDPGFALGCMATSFEVQGEDTEDAQAYVSHGVPVYDGFFRVDVTGTLAQGVSPIFLEPLTRAEATSS